VGEANQGNDDVGEPNNESVIEVGEPKKAWTALRLVWGWPDLTAFGLAMSMEMPVGVTMKPRTNLLHVEQGLLGF